MRLIEFRDVNQLADVCALHGIQPEMLRVVRVDCREYAVVPETDPTKMSVPYGTAAAIGRASGASEIGVGYWHIEVEASDAYATNYASERPVTSVTAESLADLTTSLAYTDTLAEVDDDEEDPAVLVLTSLRLEATDERGALYVSKVVSPSGSLSTFADQMTQGNSPNKVNPIDGVVTITTGIPTSGPLEITATYDVTAWPGVSDFPRFCYIERVVIIAASSATHDDGDIDIRIYEDAGCRLLLHEEAGVTINADGTAFFDVGRSSVAQSVRADKTARRFINVNTDHPIDIQVFAYWRRSR